MKLAARWAQEALFWPSALLLAPQALRVKRRAPRFAPPPGAAAGLAGSGGAPALRLLGLGDSVVAGVGAERRDEALVASTAANLARCLERPVRWEARGRVGARVAGVLDWLPREPVDFVLLCAGINDVTAPATLGRWRADLERVLDALEGRAPDAVMLLLGLPPLGSFPLLPTPLRRLLGARARSFDRMALSLLERRSGGVLHLPLGAELRPDQFAADGYHPSAASHAELGREAGDLLALGWRKRKQDRGTG